MLRYTLISIALCLVVVGLYFGAARASSKIYHHEDTQTASAGDAVGTSETTKDAPVEIPFVATHIATPKPLKAIYMSSWVAATPSLRAKLVNLITTTELNAVVIDIKDATGKIAFLTKDQTLTDSGSPEDRIPDLNSFIASLHEKNIYVIGRIAVFQDPYMTKAKPEWAIKKKSDGTVWKDFKGLSFLDPSKKEVWDYTVAIANESYAHGFDEINFDYVRFPSDGKISDIAYPNATGTTTRADIIKSFFAFW